MDAARCYWGEAPFCDTSGLAPGRVHVAHQAIGISRASGLKRVVPGSLYRWRRRRTGIDRRARVRTWPIRFCPTFQATTKVGPYPGIERQGTGRSNRIPSRFHDFGAGDVIVNTAALLTENEASIGDHEHEAEIRDEPDDRRNKVAQ